MKRILSLMIIGMVLITGCSFNTGIDSIDSANKEIMKISGQISEWEEIITDEDVYISKVEKNISKKIKEVERTMSELEDYTVDEKFKEKFERIEERLENLKLIMDIKKKT
jgi:vacuolar-type H+-ATPase subunit I/STV1